MKEAKHSAYDALSVSSRWRDMELVTVMLRLGGTAAVVRTAQHFAIWHRLYAVAHSRQADDLFFSSSSGSRE